MAERAPQLEGPLRSSIERLRQELDHWFEAALVQGEKALGAVGIRSGECAWVPRVDVVETDDAVQVFVELPGVDPGRVDVTLAGNMLTLRGEKPVTPRDDHAVVHAAERGTGKFCRAIPMPTPVDAEQVSAEAKDGLLLIRAAKVEQARARQIRVQSGSDSATPGDGAGQR